MARLTKAQAESLKSQAKSEEQVLKEVERSYDDALKVIEERLKKLQEREQTQSVIYQRKYQEMLWNQLTEVLEDMQDVQYTKVSDYLYECYENNYVYAMYDIHKQGVPVVVPIGQTQVVEAVKTDSKLSKSLYASMGKYIGPLKKKITQELSRGIASGMMYADIARNLKRRAGVAMRYTYRIIRTEGHRIQCKAAEDAQRAAKAKGADVVKQWDATLDGRTRRDHRKLDGQIRELDEPFEVGGHKAMRPGGFGRPEQDINCRCALLQRARWALDDEELETLKKRAEFYGLDKSDDIEDFKAKYLKASEVEEKAEKARKKIKKQSKADSDAGIKERAKRCASRYDADKVLRKATETLWKKLTKDEKGALYRYTSSYYSEINGFLRGMVVLDEAKAEKFADLCRTAIKKSKLGEAMRVRRGCSARGTAAFLGIEEGMMTDAAVTKALIGQVRKDKGFMSTGVADDAGFSGIQYSIYLPEGTEAVYCEPFRAYGYTNSNGTWDGKQKGDGVGSEAELLLQCGSAFRITDIKHDSSGRITEIELVLVSQDA